VSEPTPFKFSVGISFILATTLAPSYGLPPKRFQRLEIVEDGGIFAGLRHRKNGAVVCPLRKSLRPRTRLVIHISVERFGEGQALRRLQAERVHVVDEEQKRGELLTARTMPNSAACLIALSVSPPALATPMIFALDDYASL
jgi:hypothetical protein